MESSLSSSSSSSSSALRNNSSCNYSSSWIVRCLWCFHFFLGFVIVYAGILRNGGYRKYVPIDPRAIEQHYYPCSRAYVNVYSSSMDEPHAMICCPPTSSGSNNNNYWSWIMGSYETALCAGKPDHLPYGVRLTSLKSAWLLPLVPLLLRLLILLYERCIVPTTMRTSSKQNTISTPASNGWKASLQRFFLYFFVMNFRGWGLYILLNNIQDSLLVFFSSSSSYTTTTTTTTSCWYQEYLLYPTHVSKNCYGQDFDFSDHVVLFFGQILPVTLFEVLFCILVPLWSSSVNKSNRSSAFISSNNNNNTSTTMPFLRHFFRHISFLVLIGGFVYLNFVTFLTVYQTAAYFHTASEVIVGYIVSLCIQLPLGYILLHRHTPSNSSNNNHSTISSQTTITTTTITEEPPSLTSSAVVIHRIRHFIGIPNIHLTS